jgi:osmotically-inducible protein OsmY
MRKLLVALSCCVCSIPLLPLLHGCAPLIVAGAATTVAVVHDRRSTGTIVDDQGLELKIADRLYKDKELVDSTHINTEIYNHVVLLTGEAPSEELKRRSEQLVREIPKVRAVHNEIVVTDPNSFMARSNDGALTGKVKSVMFANSFDPTLVTVVSENGTVYLMGLVTRDEADRATDITRQVSGVQRVVKLYEYID